MTVDRGSTTLAPATRQGFAQALRYVAPLVPLCILVQAIFAGQGIFIDTDQFDIHGGLGSLTLLLALIQVVLVFFAGFRGRGAGLALALSATLVVLVIIQLGLGYSGRDGGNAAAWHVPLGVAIFGLSVGTASTLAHLRSDTSAG